MGKKAKRRQRAAMNKMNAMAQAQVEEFQARQQVAQERADKTRAQYEAFEFTNPFADARNVYEGGENLFEDMTIDMRAADFQTQQSQQQRANIMQGLKGAAGTSGVAGLAQAMASQGQLQAQQIAAGIGQQERQNQILAAQAGMQLQQLEMRGAEQQQQMILEGEAAVQAAEAGQQATLLGMDYSALAGASQAEQQAIANQMSGMGMKVSMYGSQAANNPFSQILSAGAQVAGGWATGGFKIA